MSPIAKQLPPIRRRPGRARAPRRPPGALPASPAPPDPRLTAIVEGLPTELRAIAVQLRSTIRSCAPELVGTVKWGSPIWTGRANVLCLMVYPAHLNLGFFRGAELSARFPAITGTGKSLRHVRIPTVRLAASRAVREMIRAAVRLDARGRAP
jgi:hypothetical protein